MLGQREIVAKNLLDIQAVTLRPEEPKTTTIGLKAPNKKEKKKTN